MDLLQVYKYCFLLWCSKHRKYLNCQLYHEGINCLHTYFITNWAILNRARQQWWGCNFLLQNVMPFLRIWQILFGIIHLPNFINSITKQVITSNNATTVLNNSCISVTNHILSVQRQYKKFPKTFLVCTESNVSHHYSIFHNFRNENLTLVLQKCKRYKYFKIIFCKQPVMYLLKYGSFL